MAAKLAALICAGALWAAGNLAFAQGPGAAINAAGATLVLTESKEPSNGLIRDLLGSTLLVGLALGNHYFEKSPTIPNYFQEDHAHTDISDDYQEYPFLRLSTPEAYFSGDFSHWAVPTRFGYRFIARADVFHADRETDHFQQHDSGDLVKSPSSIRGSYVFAAPQAIVRLWALEPGKGIGATFGYGLGLGYSKFSGRLQEESGASKTFHRVSAAGFGLADTATMEFQFDRFLLFFTAELVHLAISSGYYSSGYNSLGLGYTVNL